MLTCIACSKQLDVGSLNEPDDNDDAVAGTPSTRQAIKALTSQVRSRARVLSFTLTFHNLGFHFDFDQWSCITLQIKDMALKASGAYRHCKPCAGSTPGRRYEDSSVSASGSERFLYSYRRACAGGRSYGSTPVFRGLSSDEGTPLERGRTQLAAAVAASFMEEEPRDWVAQVEPGVLITFLSLPQGGNDLKRIRFRYFVQYSFCPTGGDYNPLSI